MGSNQGLERVGLVVRTINMVVGFVCNTLTRNPTGDMWTLSEVRRGVINR